jgi:tyrosinase
MRTSRRFVLKGGASFAAATVLGVLRSARAAPKFIRYNVSSPQGAAMLNSYAVAVQRMMHAPTTNPASWIFQWYTHSVRSDSSKATEIQNLGGAPTTSIAQAMWETCQAHHSTDDEDNFLPWHRLYVLYFERIVRQLSGNTNFALPYWDYTKSQHQALPEQFQNATDPVFGALFRPNRRTGVNSGQTITQAAGVPASALNLNDMKEGSYPDFCSQLDGNLHGNVHVFTGNSIGMGTVPWAANDPIFWLHHCNIDRIWAGWNAAGRSNPTDPTWVSTTFTFSDPSGQQVAPRFSDVLDSSKLPYTYDVLPKPPGRFRGLGKERLVLYRMAVGPLPIGPLHLTLEKAVAGATPSLPALAADRAVYLEVAGVTAASNPLIGYNVFLNPQRTSEPGLNDPGYVGTITFFDAGGHGNDAAHPAPKSIRRLSLDHLIRQGRLKTEEAPRIVLVSTAEPAAGAKPAIAEFRIVAE